LCLAKVAGEKFNTLRYASSVDDRVKDLDDEETPPLMKLIRKRQISTGSFDLGTRAQLVSVEQLLVEVGFGEVLKRELIREVRHIQVCRPTGREGPNQGRFPSSSGSEERHPLDSVVKCNVKIINDMFL
jgi:hypothetical protein